jgi:hypothetical protein
MTTVLKLLNALLEAAPIIRMPTAGLLTALGLFITAMGAAAFVRPTALRDAVRATLTGSAPSAAPVTASSSATTRPPTGPSQNNIRFRHIDTAGVGIALHGGTGNTIIGGEIQANTAVLVEDGADGNTVVVGKIVAGEPPPAIPQPKPAQGGRRSKGR